MRSRRSIIWFVVLSVAFLVLAFAVSSCTAVPATNPTSTPTSSAPEPSRTPTPAATPTSPPPDAELPRNAASEFDTDFSQHNAPYDEISTVLPKDQIPALDDPTFIGVGEADEWLAEEEPVLAVELNDEAVAYPIQILMWHEIVNDEVGGVPVAATYCPLCNTAILFERTVEAATDAGEAQLLDFGTTGRLRYSNLIMYDRQTESWWQQATGEAVAGILTGRELRFIPAPMIAWADFEAAYPEGRVLSRETGYDRDYGRNPYAGYDDPGRTPFLYRGPETPDVLPQVARVLGLELNGEAVAYPYGRLQDERVVNDAVGGSPIVVLWKPGMASALDASSISQGRDVGAAIGFSRQLDGRTLTFSFEGGSFIDQETGTEWSILGEGKTGPLAGHQLEPVVSVNYFWFSWAAFHPDTRLYGPGAS